MSSSQRLLEISEIKEDCLVLKDGTLRAVLLVSSINFALKSEEEQNAIIASYMSFLNSFSFPFEIVIQSRKLDIEGYLEQLKKLEKEETNELLAIQMAEYREYIGELVKLGDIMNKRFYLVVPYNPLSDKKKSFWKRLIETFKLTSFIKLSQEKFQKRKRELMIRLEQVIGGLNSMGIEALILDTQSLIELFYNTYNPDLASSQKLVELSRIQVE